MENVKLPARAKEKNVKFIISVSYNGLPDVIDMPKNHFDYWDDCGGIACEWLDDIGLPEEAGIYEVLMDWEDIDYDNPANNDKSEYIVKKVKKLQIKQLECE